MQKSIQMRQLAGFGQRKLKSRMFNKKRGAYATCALRLKMILPNPMAEIMIIIEMMYPNFQLSGLLISMKMIRTTMNIPIINKGILNFGL